MPPLQPEFHQHNPAKLMLVDDHPMMRRGLSDLIAFEDDMCVVAEADNGQVALDQLGELEVDVILLDNNMPILNGIEMLKRLRELGFAGKIILFTVSDSSEDVSAALEHGVDGYLLKDMEPDQLVDKIRRVLGGELVISHTLAPTLAKAMRKNTQAGAEQESLTPREHEVIVMIADGMSNKMIGNKLGITESTVKVHVKHILGKLGLRTRVEAAVWVVDNLR